MTTGWWRGLAATPPDPAEIALQARLGVPARFGLDRFPTLLAVLQHGDVQVTGQPRFGSNSVYFATVSHQGHIVGAVYKPAAGERTLADFPPRTLAKREVAAYLVSRVVGWPLVPPTVCRGDGPHGPGALQWYVPPAANESSYFRAGRGDEPQLRQVALFDWLTNNADRKSSHVRRDPFDQLWSIDHGLCFHHQPKRRTFIHQFDGQPIPSPLLTGVAALRDSLVAGSPLVELLAASEIAALRQRADTLLMAQHQPKP
jgi:uncharacterized repeat protein (TIGR03843 family)